MALCWMALDFVISQGITIAYRYDSAVSQMVQQGAWKRRRCLATHDSRDQEGKRDEYKSADYCGLGRVLAMSGEFCDTNAGIVINGWIDLCKKILAGETEDGEWSLETGDWAAEMKQIAKLNCIEYQNGSFEDEKECWGTRDCRSRGSRASKRIKEDQRGWRVWGVT